MVIVVPGLRARAGRRLLQHRRGASTPTARYLGKYRKNHIPHTSRLLGEVLLQARQPRLPGLRDRATRKVGVYICYDRHFPEGARLLGLNGAEIVFNPSATVAGLSQYLWKLEQPAHAVANGYFMGCINRVGTEAPWNIGKFYGTSYFVDPRGSSSPRQSEDKDELVVADLDLDMIEEVRRRLAVLPRPPPRDLRRHDRAAALRHEERTWP